MNYPPIRTSNPSVSPIVAGVGASIVRTVVPLVVGVLLTWAAKVGLNLDEGQFVEWLTVVITTVYYAVVRLLETRVAPAWGWLLGVAKVPAYPKVINTTAVQASAPSYGD